MHSRQRTSEIITKDWRKFQKTVNNPHGQGDVPLTDEELEEKFSEMVKKHMNNEQIRKIFDTIWNLEKFDDMRRLTALSVLASR